MPLLAGDIADNQPRFASNNGMFRCKSTVRPPLAFAETLGRTNDDNGVLEPR